MYKVKLGLGVRDDFGIPEEEQIRLFRQVGFDGFFTKWRRGQDVSLLRRVADEAGIEYQSIHAPLTGIADMWESAEAGKEHMTLLLECLAECEKHGVPIMVAHVIAGFDKHSPTDIGVENFRVVAEAAKKAGVKIAFENTEGVEYLEKLMTAFRDYDNVGFCWDTGHEMCYNHGNDVLTPYGDRLIATHLNDNLGATDFGGTITSRDDLHLLPFDGIIDWREIAARLHKCGYEGMLTFEVNKTGKAGRYEAEKYKRLSAEEFVTEAYIRACRAAMLKLKLTIDKQM